MRTGGHLPRSGLRRVLLVLAASGLALAGTLAPARVPSALAASDGLELTTAATYTIAPARHVVHVVLAITARNSKPNVTSGGIVTKYFYDGGRVAIQPEATRILATSGGVRLTATTKPADGYAILEVRFRSSLFYHQSTAIRVTFDLPGGAPRSTSDIRVGSAFATFVAWAFGDTGSVRVVVPAGFDAETTGSTVARSTSGGVTVFRATGIAAIGNWYLVVNADRQSALTSDRIDLSGGEHVVIRAWPEDRLWRTQVSEMLTRGLPKLVEEIGLAWPVAGDLSIFEVHTPLLEGYSGQFLQGQDKIEISEDLDDLTIIHEASHAWFNSELFDGRWINEGLANTFAARTLVTMGSAGQNPGAVSPTDKAAVRLVDWVHPGRITDVETDAREQYGYDASWTVVSEIVTDVGLDRMRGVFAAAQARQIAYVGAYAPETVSGDNDWRRLLDLLDELGHSARSDELFRQWVVSDAQAATLDERAAARAAYADLVGVSAGWKPPFFVRGPMSDWDFATATARIAEARTFLDRKLEIEAGAGLLHLPVSPDLESAYESARDSFDLANRMADQEVASIHALVTATQAVDAPRAPLVTLGLIGTTPEAALASAGIAFTNGLPFAADQANAVTALIDGAADIGRGRLLTAIAVLVVIVLLVIASLLVGRRRRQQGALASGWSGIAAPGLAESDETAALGGLPADPAAESPYATLADQPSRPLDGDPRPPEEPSPELPETEPPPAARGDAS
jgi:hypothetical protein